MLSDRTEKDGRRLRPWETAALLALCLALLWGSWAQAKQERIAAGLIRLHVLAASDAPEEQARKLRVRDAVLSAVEPALAGASDAAEARALLEAALPSIARAAEGSCEGRPVQVDLGMEDYPLRDYEDFALPAGRYLSLRVLLGEGQGHNWWCVVFPPLCLEAAEEREADLRRAIGEADSALVLRREGCELRFKLVELWGELKAALR